MYYNRGFEDIRYAYAGYVYVGYVYASYAYTSVCTSRSAVEEVALDTRGYEFVATETSGVLSCAVYSEPRGRASGTT